ncbi:MAG: hypothetical protein JXB15_07890 [Anaerolineales bacterium]|nr:hypothetical protein [Anaerolineales bacterium]
MKVRVGVAEGVMEGVTVDVAVLVGEASAQGNDPLQADRHPHIRINQGSMGADME